MMPPRAIRWIMALLLACAAESGAATSYSGLAEICQYVPPPLTQ